MNNTTTSEIATNYYSKEERAAIAKIIVEQLTGGHTGRLVAMLGTTEFSAVEIAKNISVLFNFKMCPKANYCQIELNTAMDWYTVSFTKITNARFSNKTGKFTDRKVVQVATFDGIYCDMLTETFEQFTGLRTHL